MKTIFFRIYRLGGSQCAIICAATLLGTVAVSGQGSFADYERANGLRERFRDHVFRADIQPQWLDEGERGWYRVKVGKGSYEFIYFDAANQLRRSAFDHSQLATELTQALDRSVDANDLPLKSLAFDQAGRLIAFDVSGQHITRDPQVGTLTVESPTEERTEDREPERARTSRRRRTQERFVSPDGQWVASIRDFNVVLESKDETIVTAVSFDGNAQEYYRNEIYWAPDSSRFAAIRRRAAQDHTVHFVESSPEDQLQPRLHSFDYLKPGDQVAVDWPRIFDVATRSQVTPSNALFDNPYHLRGYRWTKDSGEFQFVYNQRGHQVLRVVGLNGKTGHARSIIDETSETFIDYAYKQYRFNLDDTGEIIWMSERDGWNHLYLYDHETGQVKNQITKGEWVVRSVDAVDPVRRQIWFQASGVYSDQDPYYLHAARVDFSGENLTLLTEGNGTHRISYSPSRETLVVTYSRVDQAPVTELRRGSDGGLIMVLERSDLAPLLERGWPVPERFVAKGRDGETDIHGVIYRPTNFDPENRYPVIEHIYAGPHGSHVPKDFRSFRSSQVTAELGFIVVRIDGMGTSNRSKAFHDLAWRNLKDAGFPDRILWMQAAAKAYPSMDISRVGIYGGSAGGQNTVSALLHHGDFYDVGVADCGCHDNRMDKIWWNELWMGWPIGPHYADSSNMTHADKLTGKLLLTVGELDRNVDPASTMQLVDALIKADKEFDFFMVPGAGHGVGDGSPYMIRKRQDFFVRHLHGVEPRHGSLAEAVPGAVREAFELAPFYQQYVNCGGFPVVSSDLVPAAALAEARYLIDHMLAGREDIRQSLIDLKFRFTVMAHDEFTTDVPEHADLTPKDFWDRRARGLGATPARPSVSCGAENLLQYPGDPYHGESILIHEFAHAMHEALRVIEPEFDERLERVFQAAIGKGLWKGKYASTNRYEYWAECVQSYFDDNRENDRSHNHVDTREELEEYDPEIHALIDDVYRQNTWRFVPPTEREAKAHLGGYSFDTSPRFDWPKRLVNALERRQTSSGERAEEIVMHDIEGWPVAVDIQLLEGFDEALGKRALSLLKHQLFGIKLLLSEERIKDLQTVTIRIDRDNKTLRGMQYHPSKQWLIDNGHDSRLAKTVHIPQAKAFAGRRLIASQPRVLLHELAHAYHDQFLGFDHGPIREAFDHAKEGGRYKEVKHINGKTVSHYALTDHKEYFAEGTEAYFGANDFYPFVRSELADHDAELFALLESIWGKL